MHSSGQPRKAHRTVNIEQTAEDILKNVPFGDEHFKNDQPLTTPPIHSSRLPRKVHHTVNIEPIVEDILKNVPSGDERFKNDQPLTTPPIHSLRQPRKVHHIVNIEPIVEDILKNVPSGDERFKNDQPLTTPPIHSSPLLSVPRSRKAPGTVNIEQTVEDILKNVPRFRILCIGHSGVGKSSLIKHVFGITEAKVSEHVPGEAILDQEFVSDENKYFVLHDLSGTNNNTIFDLAVRFLREKHGMEQLKDQLHVIWLCVETPHNGGWVLEEGDKKLLELAHELQTPVVIVFTKYDLLVLSRRLEEEWEEDGVDEVASHEPSTIDASEPFAASVLSLSKSMAELNTPTPSLVTVSVTGGHEDSVTSLVDVTRKIVTGLVQGDALAIAQRTNLLMKIRVSVKTGLNYYYRALTGETPGVRQLWQCVAQIHQDIITCWNFKDDVEILRGTEFQQLMLYLIEGLHTQSPTTTSPSPDKIGRFVNLITTQIPTAPPIVTLGISYDFVKWISDAKIEPVPEVECLLMAYIVDLNSVLMSLFGPPLKPRPAGRTKWVIIKEVLEDYERSNKRKENHAFCQSMYDRNTVPSQETLRDMTIQLLEKPFGLDIRESLSR